MRPRVLHSSLNVAVNQISPECHPSPNFNTTHLQAESLLSHALAENGELENCSDPVRWLHGRLWGPLLRLLLFFSFFVVLIYTSLCFSLRWWYRSRLCKLSESQSTPSAPVKSLVTLAPPLFTTSVATRSPSRSVDLDVIYWYASFSTVLWVRLLMHKFKL